MSFFLIYKKAHNNFCIVEQSMCSMIDSSSTITGYRSSAASRSRFCKITSRTLRAARSMPRCAMAFSISSTPGTVSGVADKSVRASWKERDVNAIRNSKITFLKLPESGDMLCCSLERSSLSCKQT